MGKKLKRTFSLTAIFFLLFALLPTEYGNVEAASKSIKLNKEYTESDPSGEWTYDSAVNNANTDINCRAISIPSGGKITISGSTTADIRLYLYDKNGGTLLQNKSTGPGSFSVDVNVAKGKHYLKFINFNIKGGETSITYKIKLKKNKIYTDSESKALKFDKENTEYLVGCDYNSATSNQKSSTNCRKIKVSSDKSVKLTAYVLGATNASVRVYIYKSDGQAIIQNWGVSNGKQTTTVDLKKGTYYMKFWGDSEFHYKLTSN